MERKIFVPRPGWQERCKAIGFDFYNLSSSDGSAYWSESAGYRFSADEVDAIEAATNTLHAMCLEVVGGIVTTGNYPVGYCLTDAAKQLIEKSWRDNEPSIYGRFDLSYDGSSIKMLEYNADTPTSLLEASVAQWDWLEDRGLPDQFNSIHERLIERWKTVAEKIAAVMPRIYFAGTNEAGREDWGTIEYLMDTALQAGIDVSEIGVEDIGWDETKNSFVDVNDNPIMACFKLYPWEWMMSDEFGGKVSRSLTNFVEPAWKMLLSSKALLPELWKRFEGHPLLLPSYYEDKEGTPRSGNYARKPILSREGANVSKVENGSAVQITGSNFNEAYDKAGYVLQAWSELPTFDGFRPVIGSWVIGDESAGMGIREDKNAVTGNESHFVSHYFD
ncbi:MAG: glutathionylspermidine synthase family protein [bacterium]|nr:glutathionylspermidine synthase family protein [bacterium]